MFTCKARSYSISIMLRYILGTACLTLCSAGLHAQAHVWEKRDITLTAQLKFGNPYLDVDVWVDLKGPGFARRIYGFWDGESTFRVRVLATAPGEWTWVSGSNTADAGLNGKKGSFTAEAWSEAEKGENI